MKSFQLILVVLIALFMGCADYDPSEPFVVPGEVAGAAGASGSPSVGGSAGTSGTSGSGGTSGAGATSGSGGTDCDAGTGGTAGNAGASGTAGTSGTGGTGGASGAAGSSGTGGVSGSGGTGGSGGSNCLCTPGASFPCPGGGWQYCESDCQTMSACPTTGTGGSGGSTSNCLCTPGASFPCGDGNFQYCSEDCMSVSQCPSIGTGGTGGSPNDCLCNPGSSFPCPDGVNLQYCTADCKTLSACPSQGTGGSGGSTSNCLCTPGAAFACAAGGYQYCNTDCMSMSQCPTTGTGGTGGTSGSGGMGGSANCTCQPGQAYACTTGGFQYCLADCVSKSACPTTGTGGTSGSGGSGGSGIVDNDGDGSVAGVDCNDNNPLVHPSAPERCNNFDDDCDATIDEGCDDDNDGWCDSSMIVVNPCSTCLHGGGDCNDQLSTVNPGATEVSGNTVDENCDGIIAQQTVTDNDGDGYNSSVDCNDNDGAVHSGATEVCNGKDDDCDGVVDNACDVDNDDYCALGMTVVLPNSTCPKGGGDCNDHNSVVNPGVAEVSGNTLDENCDGVVEPDGTGGTGGSGGTGGTGGSSGQDYYTVKLKYYGAPWSDQSIQLHAWWDGKDNGILPGCYVSTGTSVECTFQVPYQQTPFKFNAEFGNDRWWGDTSGVFPAPCIPASELASYHGSCVELSRSGRNFGTFCLWVDGVPTDFSLRSNGFDDPNDSGATCGASSTPYTNGYVSELPYN